ncbi:hypothetical protein GOP47_0029651 [Adiantum capillus-veneris]|nr:hypothetical protein GOP47_0029651 [Adiantum capillus-veneris]
MAGSSGDDRVVATAHHILRTLSSSHTDDMMRILSTFDDRFSRFSLNVSRSNASDSPCARSDVGSQSGRDQRSSLSSDDEDDDDDEDEDNNGGDDEDELPTVLRSAEQIIMKWDFSASTTQTFLFSDHLEEVRPYLDAVDSLHEFVDSLSASSSPEATRLTDHAQNALQFAMLRLESEFCHVLQKHSEPADPDWMTSLTSNCSGFNGGFSFSSSSCSSRRVEEESEHLAKDVTDDEESPDGDEGIAKSHSIGDTIIDLLPPEVVTDLHSIAVRMLRSGYDVECGQVYVSIRKGIVEESLQKLGQEKFTFEEVQRMPWELLEAEISKWTRAMKVALGNLFPSEKHLCESIFADARALSDECFVDVAKTSLTQLLNFGEAIAIGRRAPEKLFKILDMYECLRDLLSTIETIFGESAKSEASAILSRLGDAARGTFAEFENAIQRETSRNPVPGGAVHPLARYVMNYMKFLCDYTETMNQLLLERSSNQGGGNPNQRVPDQSPLSAVTLSLMENLEKNLDAKSKLYKDSALTYIFLMNNIHYICQKIKASDVRKLVGDEWIKRNSGKLRQYHNSYRRTAWTKVLMCLKDEGINISGGSASSTSRNVLKERFKNFNAAFEENVKAQCSWVVWDPQLCTELRISITEMILPAYRSFLGRFQNHLDARHPEKYVKYTAEDLEGYLNDLFDGSSASASLIKRKSFPATGSAQ